MSDLTPLQELADFCADYELPKVYLRAHESLIGFRVFENTAAVLVHRYRAVETRGELRYTASGRLLRTWHDVDGRWIEQPQIMVWEDDFEPVYVKKYNSRTWIEAREKRIFEDMCWRPGNERFPMDNFDRTVDLAGDATDKMRNHWGI